MKVKEVYTRVLDYSKDILFPAFCLGCGREGFYLCNKCLQTLDRSGVFCCPFCHRETPSGSCCPSCRTDSVLDKHWSVTHYEEKGLVGKIITSFKYHYVEDIVQAVQMLVRDFFVEHKLAVDFLVPVPLHKRRLAERGFNQAEKIAQVAAVALAKPLLTVLERSRYTRQQAKLNRDERLDNLKSAFIAKQSSVSNLKGKRVLLIDDVYTTGSTMQECAKVLRAHGGSEVIGFSLARG